MQILKPKNYCRCGCGQEISATKKWVSGHNFKRRPKDAIVIKGRSYKEINCSECGGKFLRRIDQINRYGKTNLCNKECVNSRQSKTRKGKTLSSARTGDYKNCIQCKKGFYVVNYRLKYENPKYCSKECMDERKRERGTVHKNFIKSADNKGKKNGMYKNGNNVGRAPRKAKLRKEIIEREGGNWCLLCGKPEPGLHLHRIKYGSQGGKYELDNCVQLCAGHHGEVHSNKNKWMPILLDHIENKTLYNNGYVFYKDDYD